MNWNPHHFDKIKSTWQFVKIPKRTTNKNPKENVTKPKKKNKQKGKQTKRGKKIPPGKGQKKCEWQEQKNRQKRKQTKRSTKNWQNKKSIKTRGWKVEKNAKQDGK